jgi:hypothetical protein
MIPGNDHCIAPGVEDHLVVDEHPHREIGRIAELVRGDDPRAQAPSEVLPLVGACADRHLAQLRVTRREVVEQRVAEDVLRRPLELDIAAPTPDDHAITSSRPRERCRGSRRSPRGRRGRRRRPSRSDRAARSRPPSPGTRSWRPRSSRRRGGPSPPCRPAPPARRTTPKRLKGPTLVSTRKVASFMAGPPPGRPCRRRRCRETGPA